MNIGFSDAGLIGRPTGLAFGDLILSGNSGTLEGLNGLTVRQFQDIANRLLGGGTEPYSLADISATVMDINESFEGGFHSGYADTHLSLPDVTPPPPVPEPASWATMVVGLGFLGSTLGRKGRRSPRTGPAAVAMITTMLTAVHVAG